MLFTDNRRRTLLDKLAGVERDISLCLFVTNSDERPIVCEIAVAFPGFPEEVLTGCGFRPGDDEAQSQQPLRELRCFHDIAQSLQRLANDVHALLGAPQSLIKVVARYDGLDRDVQFAMGAVNLSSAQQAAHA